MVVAVAWFLKSTRAGLILRAVGENDLSAHSIGYSVIGVRYAAIAFGGAMAGIGGAYFSLVITPMWAERMTAGRGWIALALVVFASWKAPRLLVGAYFFGVLMWLEAQRQGRRPVVHPGRTGHSVPVLGRYALPHDRCGPHADLHAGSGGPRTRLLASASPSFPQR